MIYFNFSQNCNYFEKRGYKSFFLYLLSNLRVSLCVCVSVHVYKPGKYKNNSMPFKFLYIRNLYIHDSVVFICFSIIIILKWTLCSPLVFLSWMVHSWIVDFDYPFNGWEFIK